MSNYICKREKVDEFRNILGANGSKWKYANNVLYRMCKDEPKHNNADVIVAKIWLIGRSYAAAIERRKDVNDNSGDYYYDVVAPKLLEIGGSLDKKIDSLRNNGKSIESDFEQIIYTHYYLMKVFKEITGLNKRSLASKYLHFHCPGKFYIYDSRASKALRSIVKYPDKSRLSRLNKGEYDEEYADFVIRMLILNDYIKNDSEKSLTPRELDTLLLSID